MSDHGIIEAAASNMRPFSVRIPRAIELTGLSRTKLYELMGSGEIEVVKVGAITLIPFDSLARYVESRRTPQPGEGEP